MILALSIINGFSNNISQKAEGFGSSISIINREFGQDNQTFPINSKQDFLVQLSQNQDIKNIQRYITKPAIIKNQKFLEGVIIKGVGKEYNWDFFNKNLTSGKIPTYDDSTKSNEILISKYMAKNLGVEVGGNIYAYYIDNPLRMRKYTVSGIYYTGLDEYDKHFIIADIIDLQKVNNWEKNLITGFEVLIKDFGKLEQMTELVTDFAGYTIQEDGSMLRVMSIKESNRQLFDWLKLTELNVWAVLIIMFFVAFINMSTTLLIIIFERANTIANFKAMGAKNFFIQKIFIIQAIIIAAKGILWGNIGAFVFIIIQKYFEIFKLNPENYYIDHVPVVLDFSHFLSIDICTIILLNFMLIIPSFAISKMQVAKMIGFK